MQVLMAISGSSIVGNLSCPKIWQVFARFQPARTVRAVVLQQALATALFKPELQPAGRQTVSGVVTSEMGEVASEKKRAKNKTDLKSLQQPILKSVQATRTIPQKKMGDTGDGGDSLLLGVS